MAYIFLGNYLNNLESKRGPQFLYIQENLVIVQHQGVKILLLQCKKWIESKTQFVRSGDFEAGERSFWALGVRLDMHQSKKGCKVCNMSKN